MGRRKGGEWKRKAFYLVTQREIQSRLSGAKKPAPLSVKDLVWRTLIWTSWLLRPSKKEIFIYNVVFHPCLRILPIFFVSPFFNSLSLRVDWPRKNRRRLEPKKGHLFRYACRSRLALSDKQASKGRSKGERRKSSLVCVCWRKLRRFSSSLSRRPWFSHAPIENLCRGKKRKKAEQVLGLS